MSLTREFRTRQHVDGEKRRWALLFAALGGVMMMATAATAGYVYSVASQKPAASAAKKPAAKVKRDPKAPWFGEWRQFYKGTDRSYAKDLDLTKGPKDPAATLSTRPF